MKNKILFFIGIVFLTISCSEDVVQIEDIDYAAKLKGELLTFYEQHNIEDISLALKSGSFSETELEEMRNSSIGLIKSYGLTDLA